MLKPSYNPDDPLEVSEFLRALVTTWADKNEGPSRARRAIQDIAGSGDDGMRLLRECSALIGRYHVGATDMRLFPLNVIAGRPIPVADILRSMQQELNTYIRRLMV